MKTIQVKYKTLSGDWLADINFTGIDAYMVSIKIIMMELIFNILTKRYGKISDWYIIKFYN